MEETKHIVIPTLSRAKISRNLSYPIGAERISEALASTAQLPELKLQFHSGFNTGPRIRHFEFLRVEYLSDARESGRLPIFSLWPLQRHSQWEIVVQPVPRVLRHRIKQYITKTALEQVALWLRERARLQQEGNDILAFFYDENTEEFTPERLTRLEPLRLRAR